MKDLGTKLLKVLREQRKYFIRIIDNKKIITNHIMYNSLEDEALELQRKIGRENKRIIIAECNERGIPIPNFRKEGIEKPTL